MSLLDEITGHVIDEKYRVETLLGRGGMGAVYRATHVGTARPVALKIIAPQFMNRPDAVQRFRREARATGSLRHRNIVNVTDFGFWKGDLGSVAYLVMEQLEGLSLRQLLDRQGKLPVRNAIEILDQVCAAMDHAHRQGVLHRDLKPENVWLEPNDLGGYTVKVLDFGLARIVSTEESETSDVPVVALSSDEPTLNVTPDPPFDEDIDEAADTVIRTTAPPSEGPDQLDGLPTEAVSRNGSEVETLTPADSGFATRAGALLGTPFYMSPEQCRGELVDARSDIYSLSVILYEMLTGGRPFTGSSQDVIWKHCNEPPPPLSVHRKNVPNGVAEVIERSLSKRPEDRPPSAAALAAMLSARSETLRATLRNALVLYTQHFRLVFFISSVSFLPTLFVRLLALSERDSASLHAQIFMLGDLVAQAFALAIIIGLLSPMLAQVLLRPYGAISIAHAVQRLKEAAVPFTWAYLLFMARLILLTGVLGTVLFIPLYGVLQSAGNTSSVNSPPRQAGELSSEPAGITESTESTGSSTDEIATKKSSTKEFASGFWDSFTAPRAWEESKASEQRPHPTKWWDDVAALLSLFVMMAVLATFPGRLASSALCGPALMMEHLSARTAIARSRELYPSVEGACIGLTALILLLYMGRMLGSATRAAIMDFVFLTQPAYNATLVAEELIYFVVLVTMMPVALIALTLLYFRARQSHGTTLLEILAQYEGEESLDKFRSSLELEAQRYSSGASRLH